MKKHTIGFLAGLLVAMTIMLAVMFASIPKSGDHIPSMVDGSYTAYQIQAMYDSQTGEPVYWVTGGIGHKGTLALDSKSIARESYFEPNTVRLYIIPRNKLVGLAEVDLAQTPQHEHYRIDVANGVGQIVQH